MFFFTSLLWKPLDFPVFTLLPCVLMVFGSAVLGTAERLIKGTDLVQSRGNRR